jgi:glycosyltransferase involved in cell wall biosynthesis
LLSRVAQLAAARAQLDLALLWSGDATALPADTSALFDEVRSLGFPKRLRAGTAAAQWRAQREFRRWIDAREPDLLLSFSFPIALRAASLASRSGIPNAWLWQQSLPLFGSRFGGAKQRLSLSLLRRARTQIICPTRRAVRDFVELGLSPDQLHHIPNGIDVDHFSKCDGVDPAGPFPGADLIAVCVARLAPIKGHATLIEAVALAARAGLRVVLLCVGDTPRRNGTGGSFGTALREQARAAGVADQVIWAGHRDDVRPWLAAADVAVLASRNECAPLALAEAGASGLPLLGSNVGGITEMIEEGGCGLLFEPGNAAACAKALVELAHDAGLRQRLGAHARRHVADRLDARQCDREWTRRIENWLGDST